MSVTGFGGEGLVAGRDGEMGATPQGSGADKAPPPPTGCAAGFCGPVTAAYTLGPAVLLVQL
jgi:hypothetical protein